MTETALRRRYSLYGAALLAVALLIGARMPAGAAAPAHAAAGLCQCIAPGSAFDARCLGSAATCESVCGSQYYSFVPDAPLTCSGAAASGASAAAPASTRRAISVGR